MGLDNVKELNRLVIYFFYDADGIVDRYVLYMLSDMLKNCKDLLVVSNGALTSDSRNQLNELGVQFLERENAGFDVWAYKTALEHYGWETLTEYDEVVLMNHTIMGPIYPFSEMFAEMNNRDVDFWGITKFHNYPFGDPFDTGYGYIPEHIQSHFIAIRKSLLRSQAFHTYWMNRPMIHNYEEAIGKHEAIFTKHFADLGFCWDVYVDTSDFEGFTSYPLFYCPTALIEKYRCPVFKRKEFFYNYKERLDHGDGHEARRLFDYLKTATSYDVGMIWENILRTCNQRDISDNLNLNYIIANNHRQVNISSSRKIALAMHIYFEDQIEYCFGYAKALPDNADVFITTDADRKKEKIERIFGTGPWKNLKVIVTENRGRDVGPFLVVLSKCIQDYDYVCYAHDKKVGQLKWGYTGYCFAERCFRNVLGNREAVNEIIELFESDPYLGMVCPPTPNFAEFFYNIGSNWGMNFSNTKKLHEDLGLHVPISEDKEPVAPYGSMFWFRPAAMKTLFDKGWEYADFPEEPVAADGTLLHAIERIHPFVVQDAGYYVANIMTQEYAQLELTNMNIMLAREKNTSLKSLIKSKIKSKLKPKVPKPIRKILKKTYHLIRKKRKS